MQGASFNLTPMSTPLLLVLLQKAHAHTKVDSGGMGWSITPKDLEVLATHMRLLEVKKGSHVLKLNSHSQAVYMLALSCT
jgi:hypothetical protein